MATLSEVMDVARAFASLGHCMGKQVMDVVNETRDPDTGDMKLMTPGAAEYCRDRLIQPLESIANNTSDDDLVDTIHEFVNRVRTGDAEL